MVVISNVFPKKFEEIDASVGKHVPSIAKHPVFPAAVSKLMPPPWKVDVAVVEAKRPVVPASEKVAVGDVVPIPSFPEKNAVVVFGSNQYSAVVVAVEPTRTTSDVLFG